jgi:hypothetical protein
MKKKGKEIGKNTTIRNVYILEILFNNVLIEFFYAYKNH